jgi:glycosyltransferase involved in cell wall biosynthesis
VIFVSMPYYNTPETIERAVDSIINQTYTDWRLSIVVDGCNPPKVSEDPRIRLFHVEQNRGAFYCSALNLAVCDTQWWTVHDSDDYSERDRFQALIDAADGHDGVLEDKQAHMLDGSVKVIRASHTSLFKADLLRLCGPHPDFRVSWDDAMARLYERAYKVNRVGAGKYHAVKRPNSLTVRPETGMKSAYRQRMRARREMLVARCMVSTKANWPRILAPKPETKAALSADIQRYRDTIKWE